LEKDNQQDIVID